MSIAILGVSLPVIVLGPILVWVFGVNLKILPVTGWGAKPPFTLGILPRILTPITSGMPLCPPSPWALPARR